MYTSTTTARPIGGIRSAFRRAEAWLDGRGKWAWIAAMVLSFIIFWPIGLALLAYMIWGKQMFARSCGPSRQHQDHAEAQTWGRHGFRAAQPTGNRTFDTYKAEALRRLEEEQDAFEAFLQRLRTSKDKTQFDAFMDERARSTVTEAETDAVADTAPATAKPEGNGRPGEY